ncbi:MAG: hypothetical protein OEW67_03265 [Cyclobacteriaceae bacterium]|nr:hypothetical protein [Cyclobacteriaceae bacterium]
MSTKLSITLFLCLITLSVFGQNYYLKSRVYLEEKQNKPAAAIPEILLDAYSKGDIKAYYPQQLKTPVPYAQFLKHFGMESKAYQEIANDHPIWFCNKRNNVKIDPYVKKCMQYSFELGEVSVRNNITYQQDIKMVYVKVIYSGECTTTGLEVEGPVFKLGDIRKLKNREYKIVNYENTSISYNVADYLNLRLFRAVD